MHNTNLRFLVAPNKGRAALPRGSNTDRRLAQRWLQRQVANAGVRGVREIRVSIPLALALLQPPLSIGRTT